jgi:3-oxoacyl-[acyl-carrier-protein] synthase-3
MDGPGLVKFTLDVVPPMIHQVLAASGWSREEVDYYLMHQATALMLEHVRAQLDLDPEKMPLDLEESGNTVCSTIPILVHNLRRAGRLPPGARTLLVGFGVGLSWAGCTWTETWRRTGCP